MPSFTRACAPARFLPKTVPQDSLCSSRHARAVVVLDAPLLFETRLSLMCDATVVVHVREEAQLSRLMARDKFGREEAQSRIAAQMPLAQKVARATFTIDNNGSVKQTHQVVAATYARLLERAAQWSLGGLLRAAFVGPLLAIVAAADLTLERM